ncbi:hypothetical protein RA281_27395, partial [Pseudomonas syringae pv. tagetis]
MVFVCFLWVFVVFCCFGFCVGVCVWLLFFCRGVFGSEERWGVGLLLLESAARYDGAAIVQRLAES